LGAGYLYQLILGLKDEKRRQAMNGNSFQTLRLVGKIIEVLGWVIFGSITLITVSVLIMDVQDGDDTAGLFILGGGALLAVNGLLVVGVGQLIKLFLKIEKNTRKPCNHAGESGKYCTKCGEGI
jgi:hypothetical protein